MTLADSTPDLVAAFYRAAATGDTESLRTCVTDEVVVLWNGDPALVPWAGRHAGVDAVMRFFQTFQHHVEVVSVTPGEMIVTDAAVVTVVEGRWRVRDTDGIFATRSCNIFRLRAGRIACYEVYNDTAPFAAALASVAG